MTSQFIKEEVMKITKPLSLEDVNDIFYKIILEKKPEQSEDELRMVEYLLQNRQKRN